MNRIVATKTDRSNRRTIAGRPGREQAVRSLSGLCSALRPGDRIPTHTELMRQLGLSERAILSALDDLQRAGRVVRKNGVGTFVADPDVAPPADPIVPAVGTDRRTVVAIATPDNSFFDRCVERLYRSAEAAGLSVVYRLAEPGRALTYALPDEGAEQPIGYVLLRYDLAPVAARLQERGARVVMVGVPPADVTPELPCVHGDHEAGGRQVAEHLIGLGHRRIAFVSGMPASWVYASFRWQGMTRAVREAAQAGISVSLSLIFLEDAAAWERDPSLAERFFARPDAPTALAVWDDFEAAPLVGILARAGVRVPEDVSLVGYDALAEGRLVYPPLTTVDQGIDRQVQAAIDILARPAPPPAGHTVVVLPSLIVRESTAPPRGAPLPAGVL